MAKTRIGYPKDDAEPPKNRLTARLIEDIRAYRKRGIGKKLIARYIGVPQTTTLRWIKRVEAMDAKAAETDQTVRPYPDVRNPAPSPRTYQPPPTSFRGVIPDELPIERIGP